MISRWPAHASEGWSDEIATPGARFSLVIAVVGTMAALPVHAGFTSAHYSVTHADFDAAGVPASSAHYSADSSLPGLGQKSVSTGYTSRVGYAGQLNDAPVANGNRFIVRGTSAAAFSLVGFDADGDALTYRIEAGPGAGALSGTAPSLVYTPGVGFTTGDRFTFTVNDGIADSVIATIQLDRTRVVGRWVFYNQSAWDGNTVGADARDDAAIATNKVALFTAVKAGFANYTSYTRGLNGIMIDVEALPLGTSLSGSDFGFRAGNNSAVSGWAVAPGPLTTGGVTVRRGAGTGGSDRITLVWGSDAVTRKWLQIRVKATAPTGLFADDLFYFGNAVGESGNRAGTDAIVNATDEILARSNPRGVFSPAPVTFAYDFNRDKLVNATDQIAARLNTTSAFTALQLITPGAAALPSLTSLRSTAESAPREGEGSTGARMRASAGESGGEELTAGRIAPESGFPGSALGIVTLSDGRVVVHAATESAVAPFLEVADTPGNWSPAPFEVDSLREGEHFWLVDSPVGVPARFFRLSHP